MDATATPAGPARPKAAAAAEEQIRTARLNYEFWWS